MILNKLIQDKKRSAFVKEYQDKVTDQEALGILVSQYYEWDGLRIIDTFLEALTDANFHSLRSEIEDLLNKKDWYRKRGEK